jgi:hypothetical protein
MSNLIKRYRFDEYYNEGDGDVEDEAGEYVKFDDIKELLNTAHNISVMPCAETKCNGWQTCCDKCIRNPNFIDGARA